MKIDAYSLVTNDLAMSALPEPVILGQSAAMTTTPIIAQQFEDNFFNRSGDIIGDFVESGQLWALLLGVVLGYLIRGITAY